MLNTQMFNKKICDTSLIIWEKERKQRYIYFSYQICKTLKILNNMQC